MYLHGPSVTLLREIVYFKRIEWMRKYLSFFSRNAWANRLTLQYVPLLGPMRYFRITVDILDTISPKMVEILTLFFCVLNRLLMNFVYPKARLLYE